MTDAVTSKRLEVADIGKEWPYIRLPYSQMDEALRVLEAHRIRHWMSEDLFSWEGGPMIAYIQLGRWGNGAGAQAALDTLT